MSGSLRTLYTPPRALELPPQAPSATSDLIAIGLGLLRAGAVYAPYPPVFLAGEPGGPFIVSTGRHSPPTPPREGGSPEAGDHAFGAATVCTAAAAAAAPGGGGCVASDECIACQARAAAAGYYARQGGGGAGEGAGIGSEGEGATADDDPAAAVVRRRQQRQQQQQCGNAAAESSRAAGEGEGEDQEGLLEPDLEKALRGKVASCLSALKRARGEAEAFSEELEQAHIQVRKCFFFFKVCEVLLDTERVAAGGGSGGMDALSSK